MASARPAFAFLAACFFLSGAMALVCEVVWLRMLGLVFGHTVYAVTTVLAAFMAGLGLGSVLFGRLAGRFRNPIRTYGIVEIGVGLSAALTPWLLGLMAWLYVEVHRAVDLSYDAFSAVQFLLAFALFLVPTTLMGGTLPLLSQAAVVRGEAMARPVGLLYGINTFGAVLGVALAGYVLLPWLGNRATVTIAAAGNVAVGVAAILFSRSARASPSESASRPESRGTPASERDGAAVWPVVALAISGAASMIYEVAWTRALSLVIGSSTYAFTAMLLAFLVGIAGGSALYAWRWGRHRATRAAFATLQIATAGAAVLALVVFERMPELFLVGLRWSDAPRFVLAVQVAVSAVALLPSTLLIGATFPCAAGAAASARGAGRRVGLLYAGSTLGAIGGTVVAGFVLVPWVGVHSAITIGAALNFLLGAVLLLRSRPATARPRWAAAAAALAGLGVLFLPIWDVSTMASGPAVYARRYLGAEGERPGEARPGRQILFYRDGTSATVAVERSGGFLSLLVNGKADASTAPADMPTQLMLGHLPLLLHAEPRTVLVIGLGSGITAGAVARHPVQRLDVVEIEPAVIAASRFFREDHGDVLADPRVRAVVGDARNFLVTSPTRYDAIISEPSNPWIGGVASLFSLEFFRLARAHLQPGGLMLQWIHAYSLKSDDLRMVVETFRTAFPAMSIWQVSPGDFLLLGQRDPAPLDLALLKARYQANPAVRRDLERIGLRGWSGVLGYFVLGPEDAARYARGAALNTDDGLALEFSAPRSLYLDTHAENGRALRSFRTAALPEVTGPGRAELENPEVRSWIGATRATLGIGE